ncbi:unnamed protein product [Gongylonema pulchrum]|uniref:Transmembrane protein n=1 Tax=Gongylonema pulchrum TaxID=637853 RepID=A0A183DNR4_9BILA|nr:unnamed protein product [Gongylonema pulchrum]
MIFLDKGLERLLDRYIREHCEKQKQHGIMATAGFLIGSKLNDDFHLAHIALNYLQNGDSYSKLIDAEWISDTGARVLRLLPGGLTIVGLLWLAGPKNSLQSAEIRAMLVRALAHILVNHNALNTVLVDGCLRSRDEPLKPRDKKASGKNKFHIETFLDVTVPSKATVGQAVDAVKEHIIRTLCSRAEIHYESTDVVEDEPNDRVSVHQLPRPGFASLPSQPAIVFTDYLFESDTASDAQQSFADLLTLTIPEDEIEIDSERLLDEGDLYSIVSDDEKPSRVERSSSSTSSLSSVVLPPIRKGTKKLPVNMYAIVAALVALLSFVVYILMKALSS